MVAKNLLCNVIVVWSVRHMPNHLPFSSPYSVEEIQDIFDAHLRTHVSHGTLPMVHARMIDDVGLEEWRNGPNSSSKQYANCDECYDFSMLFGGGHKGQNIETEEQFEIVKEKFVTHFNKCHKDIMEKRPEYKEKKFKKIERDSDFGDRVDMWTTPSGSAAFYGTSVLADGIARAPPLYVTTPPLQEGCRTPEYELEVRVNPDNLDRNARFRASFLE